MMMNSHSSKLLFSKITTVIVFMQLHDTCVFIILITLDLFGAEGIGVWRWWYFIFCPALKFYDLSINNMHECEYLNHWFVKWVRCDICDTFDHMQL